MTKRSADAHGGGVFAGLKRTLAREGVPSAARKVLRRLAALLFRRLDEIVLLQEFSHDQGDSRDDERGADPDGELDLKEVTPDVLPLLGRFAREHAGIGVTQLPTMRNYLENGFQGVVLMRDNAPVGFTWWAGARVPVERQHPAAERLGIDLGSDEALWFDFFLAPESRGGGTSARLVRKLIRKLRAEGYARAYGYVDAGNIGGRVLWRIVGCQELRHCRCVRILSFLLLVDRRMFVKNGPWSRPHGFDYRPLRLPIPGSR